MEKFIVDREQSLLQAVATVSSVATSASILHDSSNENNNNNNILKQIINEADDSYINKEKSQSEANEKLLDSK